MPQSVECKRLEEHRLRQANWRKWGPYLSERAWGTVREDYSEEGECGIILPMTKQEAEPIAGVKRGLGAFLTAINIFALLPAFGINFLHNLLFVPVCAHTGTKKRL